MKITKVETIRSEDRSYCWILITTDAGYVGVGETYHRADPAEIVIHEFARGHLLGQNPEDIEKIWNRMYRSASFHGLMGAELRAMSGIDMALWDLVGKTLDRPLYRILGGKTRSKVPVYFSGIYDETDTSRRAFQSWSKKCVDAGWKACKTARFFGDFIPVTVRPTSPIRPVISAQTMFRGAQNDSSGCEKRSAMRWRWG